VQGAIITIERWKAAGETAVRDTTYRRWHQRRDLAAGGADEPLDRRGPVPRRSRAGDPGQGECTMKGDGAPHPVELLRDQRGVYGIGVSDLFDFEVVAWSCGIEPEAYSFERPPGALILRPDWLAADRPLGANSFRPLCAVLQKIAGGFRSGPFMRSHEEQLRQFIHHEVLNRSGLPWPPNDLRWWSEDKKQQTRNRGVYHGLRRLSLSVINHLIGRALEEAADADRQACAANSRKPRSRRRRPRQYC
jgi:hypothetical protein